MTDRAGQEPTGTLIWVKLLVIGGVRHDQRAGVLGRPAARVAVHVLDPGDERGPQPVAGLRLDDPGAHRPNILSKLSVGSRGEAVALFHSATAV
jgi:hypothetical protein